MNSTVKQILDQKGKAIWLVTPETTIHEALLVMSEKDIGAVMVVEKGKLVGIFSERDYTRHSTNRIPSMDSLPVSTLMSHPVITTSLNQTVEECMVIMTQHHIRHIPVIDQEEIVGIVTIGDVVKAIIADQSLLLEEMENYISGRYGR